MEARNPSVLLYCTRPRTSVIETLNGQDFQFDFVRPTNVPATLLTMEAQEKLTRNGVFRWDSRPETHTDVVKALEEEYEKREATKAVEDKFSGDVDSIQEKEIMATTVAVEPPKILEVDVKATEAPVEEPQEKPEEVKEAPVEEPVEESKEEDKVEEKDNKKDKKKK